MFFSNLLPSSSNFTFNKWKGTSELLHSFNILLDFQRALIGHSPPTTTTSREKQLREEAFRYRKKEIIFRITEDESEVSKCKK